MRMDPAGLPRALFASTSTVRADLERWDAALRRPSGGVRRIGFLSADPGAGTTTLAHQVVRALTPRRPGPLLAVDAAGTTPALAARFGVAVVTPSSATRSGARTSADALTDLPVGTGGEHVLFPAREGIDAIAVWLDDVAPIARFFDVVVTDFGTRHPLVDMAAAAALCDVVCVVAAADRGAAEVAASLAAGLAVLPERPQPVVALVDSRGTAARAARVVAGNCGFPVVVVPADPGLAAGAAPRRMRARTAILELASTVLQPEAAGAPEAAA